MHEIIRHVILDMRCMALMPVKVHVQHCYIPFPRFRGGAGGTREWQSLQRVPEGCCLCLPATAHGTSHVRLSGRCAIPLHRPSDPGHPSWLMGTYMRLHAMNFRYQTIHVFFTVSLCAIYQYCICCCFSKYIAINIHIAKRMHAR